MRDYLRVTLVELLGDQRAARSRVGPHNEQAAPPPEKNAAHNDASQFVDCWRDDLLDRAWEELERAERQGGPPYYSALRYHAEHPEQSSAEIALEITLDKHLPTALSGHDFRDLLQRARQQYADHLLSVVADSLPARGTEHLEQELGELDLLRFCRGALQRRSFEQS